MLSDIMLIVIMLSVVAPFYNPACSFCSFVVVVVVVVSVVAVTILLFFL
jgi:hypothetical protein